VLALYQAGCKQPVKNRDKLGLRREKALSFVSRRLKAVMNTALWLSNYTYLTLLKSKQETENKMPQIKSSLIDKSTISTKMTRV
jgi:hypothetical protein